MWVVERWSQVLLEIAASSVVCCEVVRVAAGGWMSGPCIGRVLSMDGVWFVGCGSGRSMLVDVVVVSVLNEGTVREGWF